MNTCLIRGSLAQAVAPSEELSVGSSRQPRTESPCSATSFSKRDCAAFVMTSSGELKTIPTP